VKIASIWVRVLQQAAVSSDMQLFQGHTILFQALLENTPRSSGIVTRYDLNRYAAGHAPEPAASRERYDVERL
jgi:hypothetical protein